MFIERFIWVQVISIIKPIVIFDIGAVLLELTYGRFKSEFSARNPSIGAIDEYRLLEMQDMLGQVSKGEYVGRVKAIVDPENTMSTTEVVSMIDLCWGKQIDEMVALKAHIVQKGCAVGLLSNTGLYSCEVLQKKCPEIYETYGGPKIYSYEVGIVKPDNRIYGCLSKEYSPVFFIDDKESYLVPAEKFGWTGIYFTPYIDSAEMIRGIKGHTGNTSSKIKVADSVADVVNILASSGIKM